jgi:hypothetical protein
MYIDDLDFINEARSIVQCSVRYSNNTFTINYPSGPTVYNGTPEGFAKFLRKIGAKDSTNPKSGRVYTFSEIVDRIVSGKDPVIYIWSNELNGLNSTVFNENINESKKEKYKVKVFGD